MLGAFGSGSCGGGDSYSISVRKLECDLTSQRNEQRRSGKKRENYYPKVFSRDFSREYGVDISPTEEDYDTARKISRSVFEIETRKGDSLTGSVGSGWLAAPKYVITAAHVVDGTPGERILIRTFEGEIIEAVEVVYRDNKEIAGTDLALLKLEREIDAVPLKIAEKTPERNEFLMGMGTPAILRGLGGWTVSAGPALEPERGYRGGERIHHAVPFSGGMSGGPIFNRDGEVVSLVSAAQCGPPYRSILTETFGVMPLEVRRKSPENLWVYAFVQPYPYCLPYGPNPMEIREVFEMIPPDEKPDENRAYRNNEWQRTSHEFGNEYSPFPLDQFDHMQTVYKEARQATVVVSSGANHGSGFIYDEDTVVTVGHVVPDQGYSATIETEDGKRFSGTVKKTQLQDFNYQGCDIAVIKMNELGSLKGYKKLRIVEDSSSLKCGDPLVAIGSADVYNSVGYPQGVGAVYTRSTEYVSEFISHFAEGGMSGGPIIDKNGEVVSLSSISLGRAPEEGAAVKPGPLLIRTRIPVYSKQDFSEGPRAEIIKRFVEEDGFFCPAQ